MIGHGIVICRECEKVITQCRCIDCNKKKYYVTCVNCIEKEEEILKQED